MSDPRNMGAVDSWDGRLKKTVDIAFCDDGIWAQDFILEHLNAICIPRIVSEHDWHKGSVEIVFIGDGKSGQRRKLPNAKHVLLTTEDLYPDFSSYDYVIAYQYVEHPYYLRMPNWAILARPQELIKPAHFSEVILGEAREFCAFVQSNGNPRRTKRRLDFFTALNKRRFVHSGGRVRNNIGYRVESISEFLRGFQFALCFENNSSPGYTTEKVLNAILSGCIPIYWGDPEFHRDINPECVILVDSFKNDQAALDHILEVADDVELRKKYLDAPFFHGNCIPPLLDTDRIRRFLCRILDNSRPVRSVFSIRHRLFDWRKKFTPYFATFWS